jgi:hypothetical protein
VQVAPDDQIPSQQAPAQRSGTGWQGLWFLAHLAAIYAIVHFCTPSLAGWTRETLLPLLQRPTDSGRFEFFFSHILAFSFIPAFLAGLLNARFKHKAAQLVWIVPALILAYKYLTFTPPSGLANQSGAFHYYFGGDFVVPEFRSYHEMFEIAASNADMSRGMDQLKFTAPFYASVGYALAAWIGCRTQVAQKVAARLRTWEESRFKRPE